MTQWMIRKHSLGLRGELHHEASLCSAWSGGCWSAVSPGAQVGAAPRGPQLNLQRNYIFNRVFQVVGNTQTRAQSRLHGEGHREEASCWSQPNTKRTGRRSVWGQQFVFEPTLSDPLILRAAWEHAGRAFPNWTHKNSQKRYLGKHREGFMVGHLGRPGGE